MGPPFVILVSLLPRRFDPFQHNKTTSNTVDIWINWFHSNREEIPTKINPTGMRHHMSVDHYYFFDDELCPVLVLSPLSNATITSPHQKPKRSSNNNIICTVRKTTTMNQRTCNFPRNSLSPRHLTYTRSSIDKRIRSNGSSMAVLVLFLQKSLVVVVVFVVGPLWRPVVVSLVGLMVFRCVWVGGWVGVL